MPDARARSRKCQTRGTSCATASSSTVGNSLARAGLASGAATEPTATTGIGETEHIASGIDRGVWAALDARAASRLAEVEAALRRIEDACLRPMRALRGRHSRCTARREAGSAPLHAVSAA